ncbi:hypothetical protein HZ326_28827, partial [Fusarium oxysporum f. sp. albedinis]
MARFMSISRGETVRTNKVWRGTIKDPCRAGPSLELKWHSRHERHTPRFVGSETSPCLMGQKCAKLDSDKQPTARGHATLHGCRKEYQHHPLDSRMYAISANEGSIPPLRCSGSSQRCPHGVEPYALVQDYHRQQQRQQHQRPLQPPSPAHPAHHPYLPYGPRDPPIERDPIKDGPQPNSKGHVPKRMSLTHLPTLPTPVVPGAPQRMNYEGAPSMPPTPDGYGAPTSLTRQTSCEQLQGYFPEPFSDGHSPPRKKVKRVSQACDNCRQLKTRCDGSSPCKNCKEKVVECKYRDPVPKPPDKAQADILEGLGSVQTSLGWIMEHVGQFDQRLTKIEFLLPKHIATSALKTKLSVENEDKCLPASTCAPNDDPVDPYRNNAHHDHLASEPMALRTMAEDEMEIEPGPPVSPGEPAIPINHTTLAGLLLEWPSIRELTKHHVEREGIRYISEYPISQEQNRGVLIVYGRGEDSHPLQHVREPTDHGNLDMADCSS